MRFCILGVVLMVSPTLHAQTPPAENTGPNTNIVREVSGTMTFTQMSDGRVRGHEYFRTTTHRDGTRTMNITKDISAANAFQTIIVRVAPDFHPLETYAAYWTGEGYRGSIQVTVTDGRLRAVSTAPLGVNTHEIAAPPNLSVVTHGEIMNGWYLWTEDPKSTAEQKAMSYNLNPVARGNAPVTGTLLPSSFTRKNAEKVTTPAGTFDTVRYVLGELDMWIGTADRLLIRQVDAKAGREYLLTDLKVVENK